MQSFGFARRLAYLYYGSNVSGWTPTQDSGLDSLKAGDVVDYGWDSEPGKEGNHTIWITSVSPEYMTYTDCNGTGVNCQIRWDKYDKKSIISDVCNAGHHYMVWHAPYAAVDIVSMFSGLLYCADCGSKLGYSATNNYKREQAFFFCSAYRSNSDVCSAHFIWEKVIGALVLEGLQRLLWYIQVYEKRFAQEQMERFGLQEKKALTAKRRELDKAKVRVVEIDQHTFGSPSDIPPG